MTEIYMASDHLLIRCVLVKSGGKSVVLAGIVFAFGAKASATVSDSSSQRRLLAGSIAEC